MAVLCARGHCMILVNCFIVEFWILESCFFCSTGPDKFLAMQSNFHMIMGSIVIIHVYS